MKFKVELLIESPFLNDREYLGQNIKHTLSEAGYEVEIIGVNKVG